ncbi:aldehyde dehydrogenase family protein [Leeia sp. TBRC 13508]|uniref:aldehyde dehydrogenase (NAD(+)) n=1 Tax=Leeia speluncae TaxID=2884804 RepID=A0ABS8D8D6_9NEIS|nr:aldehyde dehydrogenase family protein [Leeia speluncae]MCB6184446.1 aldehyde dehydrogenase family protein [Leeia speluncae]
MNDLAIQGNALLPLDLSQPIDGMLLNNQWQAGHGELFNVMNPSTGEVLARVKTATAADVPTAVAAAKRALPAWKYAAPAERAKVLRQIATGIASAAAQLEAMQQLNSGKPAFEASLDVADAIATFEYYADLISNDDRHSEAEVALPDDAFEGEYVLEACGIAGLIVPWNFPMVTTAWKVAPALAAGCCVILKPAELTPLSEILLANIIAQSGIPDGVFNVLVGAGSDVGAAMVDHPEIDKISFTGSNAVGRKVMAAAARFTKPVSLELGGKSSLVVCEDADLDTAVDLALKGVFFNAGQMCSATSRILVAESIYPAFKARFVAATEAMVCGAPSVENVEMGPLISEAQLNRVMSYIRAGKEAGAHCLTGGERVADSSGYFIAPTIFENVPEESAIWKEEIFGPVACLMTFQTDEEAIEIANHSDYGLVATVVSQSKTRSQKYTRQLHVGMVWVNSPQVIFPHTSWGGMKQSGIGRELGPWGLRAYQQLKHVVSLKESFTL